MKNNENNPWAVFNLEEFLYFCCPECELSRESIYQSRELFLHHALDKHPKSKEYFQKFDIKEEPLEDDSNNGYMSDLQG